VSGRLLNKVAAITGAASGLGLAAALAFAAEGAQLALMDANEDALRQVALQLGPPHMAVATDVTSEKIVATSFAAIEESFGRLDVLYNCAGIELVALDAPVHLLDLEAWRRTLDTNLTGTFLTCKHGALSMLRTGSGSIINCGSPAAISGRSSEFHAYSASKGGVHALTRAMAAAYGKSGIRVNCVVPGATRTPMNASLFSNATTLERLTARSALGRLGEPEDIAGIAVYLASDESAWTTGATFIVDGGINIT
jgi:NAD(P)-dependent dehydrogenase (short-subunit alcohol dehydrogenase family)